MTSQVGFEMLGEDVQLLLTTLEVQDPEESAAACMLVQSSHG
jgi:hypothetical protein